MATVNDLRTAELERLLRYKRSWENAKNNKDDKDATRWHDTANALRKSRDIEGDNYSADQLEEMLNSRKNPQPKVKVSRSSSRRSSHHSNYSDYDPYEEIKKLQELQKKKAIAALEKAKDNSLSSLTQEERTIKPKYYNARNDLSTQSKMGAKNFKEYYAQNGLNKSGENSQARIANEVALLEGVGNLKEAENDAFSDIERRRTGINNAYESDVAGAKAGAQASTLQALINQYNADRAYNLQKEAQLFNKENADRTYNLQRDSQSFSQGVSEAGLTGYYNGQQTMQGQMNQANIDAQTINNEINKLKLDNLPYELKGQLELLQQQIDSGKISNDKALYEYDQLINPDSDYNKMKDVEYKSKLADIAYKNKLTSNVGADNRTADQKILDKLKIKQYEKALNNELEVPVTSKDITGYTNYINKYCVIKEDGEVTGIDSNKLEEYLKQLRDNGVPDDYIIAIANQYGLPVGSR
ncbi:hypothetical protein SH1V18_03240 [Vallitalea longa]|uniref:Uncharacterized protein n=1 Tax=Vallitalea longa TaxID=2936439 RepID=A0A9W6DER0_9FIRM|nr:hypothetical protein [Vallitalea longa]GKX27844.1 hypothetical protein SH1V18_03240 [Vallitalea longa]